VVAVCDFAEEKREKARAAYPGVAVVASADPVLSDPDIDVVSVASYDTYHYEQVVQALVNGKHVFVEKPLCTRPEEARHIRELLNEHPHLKLSSNLILRQCPRFTALKDAIEAGEYGELFLVEGDYHYGRLHKITDGWRGAIEFYSVVHGGAIHVVDLLWWLTGSRIAEVSAVGNQVASRGSQFRFNDTVVSTLRFENGVIGKVGVSYGCMRPHFHGLSIHGTGGTFVNAWANAWRFDSRDPDDLPIPITDAYPGVHKGDLIASFLDAIRTGGEGIVSSEDVFRTMSVCLAIEESVKAGRVMEVEYV
jgi:predicted dehydrogenase